MIWKKLKYKDVKDIYEISENGDVRNVKTGKYIKPYMGNNNYLQVKLARVNKKAPFLLHVLVAYTFLENDSSIISPEVNHIIADKYNNSVSNLEIISKNDNIKHAVNNDLYEKLENRYNASLTNDDVHKICKRLEEGIPYKQIRKELCGKLSKDVLKKIKSGENYKDISKYYNFENATPFRYSDKLRNEIKILLRNGITKTNDIIEILKLEKNDSVINLIKHQRRRINKGSTTIENKIIIDVNI